MLPGPLQHHSSPTIAKEVIAMTSTTTRKTPVKRTTVPAGAKQPQDRTPRSTKAKVTLIDGGREIAHRGITVTVLDEAMDDFELLDDMAAINEDRTRMPSVLRRLVGDEGYRAIMDGLRDPDSGRVTIEAASSFVSDIFEAFNPNS